MIQIEPINEAIASTVVLDSKDLFLVPESGSPLERLVTLSNIIQTNTTDVEFTPNAQLMSEDTLTVADEHGVELNKFAEDIAANVSNHLSFAKNIVKPIIEASVDRIKLSWDAISANVPSLNIVKKYLPEVADVAAFQDIVMDYKNVPYIPYGELIPNTIDLSAPEIIELIKTGNVDIDNSIALFNSRLGDEFILNIFNSIFKFTDRSIQELLNDRDIGGDVASLVFLICNKLYDNPLPGIEMQLAKYNEVIDMLRKQAAYQLNYIYYTTESRNKSGQLVIVNTQAAIVVDGYIYDKWVSAGGSDTVLFGNACHAKPELFIEDINERKQEYIDRWTQECNLIITRNNVQSHVKKKEVIYLSIVNVVKENFDLCYSHLVPEGTTPYVNIPEYKNFLDKIAKEVNELKDSDMLNLWSLVTDLVCDTVFYYTASKDIFKGVEEAMKVNKDLTIREALLLSTIKYVVDYVINQINKQR